MKHNDLVLIVAQVLQSRKQIIAVPFTHHIAKNQNQRALVHLLGNLVQGINRVGGFAQVIFPDR